VVARVEAGVDLAEERFGGLVEPVEAAPPAVAAQRVREAPPDALSEPCAGWLAHPWVTARDRAVDTAPGHRASARCDQAASVGGRGVSARVDKLTSQHSSPVPY